MSRVIPAIGLACWLGILTSVSPCPLATNIAAVSWLGTRPGRSRRVLAAGLLYSLGRVVTYVGLGLPLSLGVLSLTGLSLELEKYGSMAIGPVLVLAGMFLLELLKVRLPSRGILAAAAERPKRWGLWGAPFIGLLCAFSFCPVSAALFFGSLVPLATRSRMPALVSAVYGVGTAAPVVAVSVALAVAGEVASRRFARLIRFEAVARRLTGVVFIGAGVFLTLRYILHIV